MIRFLLLFSVALTFNLLARAQDVPSARDYPRVNGSTSTAPLGLLLASRAFGVPAELRRLPIYSYWPGSVQLTFPVDIEPEKVNQFRLFSYRNAHQGTHDAYKALAEGKSDLILVAREPSETEKALLAKNKVVLDIRPVALDAFVFLVNTRNPVQELSSAQLAAIFSGQTKLWRQVGGADLPIMALSRPNDSGSQELMERFVLKGRKMGSFPPQTRLSEMGELIERVATHADAIGYSVYYFERFMMPRPTNKLLSIDGIAPTRETIATRKYPFTAPVYMVVRADLPAEAPAARLRDWLLSPDGQKLVAASGYVPVR